MGVFSRRRDERSRLTITRPGRREALTASAESADRSSGALLRLDQPWQREAMRIYRTSGECWNPAQYQSRAAERIRYFPALRNERGQPEEIKSGPVVELFQRIQSPAGAPGDLSELAGQYARLQFVIGDGLLTVSTDDGEEVWEYLSPMELRLQRRSKPNERQEYFRHRAPGVPPEELTEAPDNEFEATGIDQARVWRLWRRHPEYSQWADSPVRPVIDLYETLGRLTLAVHAEASSRAAQRGMLFVPNEFSFSVDVTQDENPDEDPLIKELVESGSRAISNPGTAEAMLPFILRGPGLTMVGGGIVSTADLIKWIPLGPSDRYLEGEMWDKTIGRIAGAIDMPKELMTGVGDVSHWGQWFLDDIGFRQHTAPTVIRFCNDIAAAYLRPAARADSLPDAENVTVWFDSSQAVNHPDETGVARDAHDRLVVSDQWYRGKIGAQETDAPKGEELRRRIEIKLKEDPYTRGDQANQPSDGQTDPADGGRGGDVNEGPPTDSERRPAGNSPPSPSGPSLASLLAGAGEMQVVRARELAGNRLWRRAQSCDDCREDAKDVPREFIATTLGSDRVRTILDGHTTEASLVDGVGVTFAKLARDRFKINGGWPEQLGAMVEQHALRTLYEREAPRLPSGFYAACQRAVDES